MTFEALGLTASIVKALERCDYKRPTPIQEQAIPPALEGQDVLGLAQTGTGKTCAFGTPILQRLNAQKREGKAIRALILTPTRELALQIGESLQDYGKELPLRSTVIFGGVGQSPQVEQLKRGIDILTATPGRLLDLHGQGLVALDKVEIFVLDEADRMLDMGFLNDVKKIIALLPKEKQTLFFSATMPEELSQLVASLMKNPVRVQVNPVSSPVEVIRQQVYLVDRQNKTTLLAKILDEEQVKNALVFTRTKHGADKVTRELAREGVVAAAIHGNKSQTARQEALAQFKRGAVQVLVATDIAARGLDIEELSHVFNYNLPEVPETYVHRIGRTGRAGRGGVAISFCDHAEEPLLAAIEALLGKAVPRVEDHPFPMEDFAKLKRDAKGRLLHPDDEEARNAARERRQEKGHKPKAAAIAHPAKEGKGAKPTKAQAPAQKEAANKKQQQKTRPDPLKGEVIMDATARLFASKPVRKAAAAAQPKQGEGKRGKGAQPSAKKERHEGPAKGRTGDKRGNLARSAQGARKDGARKAEGPSRRAPAPAGKTEQDGKNKGLRRRFPSVEGPRSHQKDSTEQPSLMKPFYIKND